MLARQPAHALSDLLRLRRSGHVVGDVYVARGQKLRLLLGPWGGSDQQNGQYGQECQRAQITHYQCLPSLGSTWPKRQPASQTDRTLRSPSLASYNDNIRSGQVAMMVRSLNGRLGLKRRNQMRNVRGQALFFASSLML